MPSTRRRLPRASIIPSPSRLNPAYRYNSTHQVLLGALSIAEGQVLKATWPRKARYSRVVEERMLAAFNLQVAGGQRLGREGSRVSHRYWKVRCPLLSKVLCPYLMRYSL